MVILKDGEIIAQYQKEQQKKPAVLKTLMPRLPDRILDIYQQTLMPKLPDRILDICHQQTLISALPGGAAEADSCYRRTLTFLLLYTILL